MRILNFSMDVLRVKAYTLWDARNIAKEYGFDHISNVTRFWKKAGSPTDEKKLKAFQVDMFYKFPQHAKPGDGYVITLNQGVHMKKNQWKITYYHKGWVPGITKLYEIRLKSDGTLLAQAKEKVRAVKLAKKLMSKYREPIVGNLVIRLPNPEARCFEIHHTDTAKGRYLIFGISKKKIYDEVRKDF